MSRRAYSSRIACKLAIVVFLTNWPVVGETSNLAGKISDGIGLACEKEGNTNRKVYRSFFQLSKDRTTVATLDYRNDQPTITSYNEATVLPEFIEWGNFRLNRKTLILTNLSISPRRQECLVVTLEDLIERAKFHLIELQKGNKI